MEYQLENELKRVLFLSSFITAASASHCIYDESCHAIAMDEPLTIGIFAGC